MSKPVTTLEDTQAISLINKIQKDLDSGKIVKRMSDGKRLLTVRQVLIELRKGIKVQAFTEKRSPGGIILP